MDTEFDVIVAGGGTTEIDATLAAARHGARTLLVEPYGFLGGSATAGLLRRAPHPSGALKEGGRR